MCIRDRDGAVPIERLAPIAARTGLHAIALSDHDTLVSAQYAYAHTGQDGVELIPPRNCEKIFEVKENKSREIFPYSLKNKSYDIKYIFICWNNLFSYSML